jgi:hypothetical protein
MRYPKEKRNKKASMPNIGLTKYRCCFDILIFVRRKNDSDKLSSMVNQSSKFFAYMAHTIPVIRKNVNRTKGKEDQ